MPSADRRLGAALPFSDLRRGAGRAMEGYFWRFSDPGSGRVLVALCGVCADADGKSWANLALAAAPGKRLCSADVAGASTRTDRFLVQAGTAGPGGGPGLRADADGLDLDLGPEAQLRVRLEDRRDWAGGALGGVGVAQLIPGLGQYWHPHLLGARVSGEARLGTETLSLDGWTAYAEHNWGPGGFPERWWWGQAQGFADPEVCVAFAGGTVSWGPAAMTATSIVVALGGRRIRLGNPLLAPVRARTGTGRWELSARGPRWSVELHGSGRPGDAHLLPIPLPREGHSVPGAHEHLAARLGLVVRRRGRVVFAGESAVAGLEVGGGGAG